MKDIITLPSFQAVAAGQTATVDLPTNGTYHSLLVKYSTATAGGATQANMEAELTEIRIKVNGKVQRRFTAEELFDINVYHGQTIETGKLQIYFSEPWLRTVQGEDALAWGMADVSTFQVEVDIDAGATSPALGISAVWTKDARNMGPIVKWRKFVVPVAATGIVNVSTLPKSDSYYAIHSKSANIADVEVKVDQETRFEGTLSDVQAVQKNYGKVPVTGWFHTDFRYTNRASDALAMVSKEGKPVSNFQIDFNMSSATSFGVVTEVLGLRD